jgi:predicted P-loop ATPase
MSDIPPEAVDAFVSWQRILAVTPGNKPHAKRMNFESACVEMFRFTERTSGTASLDADIVDALHQMGISAGIEDDEVQAIMGRAKNAPPDRRPGGNGSISSKAHGAQTDHPAWPDLGKGGKPSATCANARMAIEDLGIECRYDVFHDRKLVGGHAIEQWAGELTDHACQMLRVLIKQRHGFDPGKENTNDAAVQLCLQHQFDPVGDYLDALKWDRVPRIDKWMTTYLGAEDTALNREIALRSLIAAVRRVRQPGCKFDQIIVLEGPEGTGKSTAIEILAGQENFSDQTIIGLDDRQQQEAMAGVWLYEIADLAGMSRADVDRTKAFASRQSDRARPAYGRHRVERPRRGILFATTNNETYLKSQTGNRRFWPVKTGRIDLDALRRDRDQLWAEAASIEATGASLKLPEHLWNEAAAEQEKRRDPDPWDDMLSGVKGTIIDVSGEEGTRQEERISTTELLTAHLQVPRDRANDQMAKRLTFCMERLGWTKPKNAIRIDGKQQRGYVRRVPEGDDR